MDAFFLGVLEFGLSCFFSCYVYHYLVTLWFFFELSFLSSTTSWPCNNNTDHFYFIGAGHLGKWEELTFGLNDWEYWRNSSCFKINHIFENIVGRRHIAPSWWSSQPHRYFIGASRLGKWEDKNTFGLFFFENMVDFETSWISSKFSII